MAGYTTTLAIDNAQDYNVVAPSECTRILVQENFNSANPPTADLIQKVPDPVTDPTVVGINIAKGTAAIYTAIAGRRFKKNDVAGTIKTASGSVTVQIIASSTI